MRERFTATLVRLVSGLTAAAVVLAGGGYVPAQDSCDGLMRELKLLAFDQEWAEVESTARRLLDLGPDCEHHVQASRLLAQSLDRQARSEEAFDAYGTFLDTWCDGTDSMVCDRARSDYYRIAATLYGVHQRQRYLDPLLDGMDRSDDAGVIAALNIAEIEDRRTRSLALPRLEEAYGTPGIDPEIKTRVCLSMLRIDPKAASCAQGSDGGGPQTAVAELISVEVWDKKRDRPELRLNMPVALAEVVIQALPDAVHAEMAREGVDIRQIFQAIREQNSGTLFEAETEEMKVRIWLQ